MRGWLLVFGLGIGACGHHPVPILPADGGDDAAVDAPIDAIDWSITIDSPEFPADPFAQHAVTVTGLPNTEVFLSTDRLHAGVLSPSDLWLDASGHGTSTYVPCSPAIPSCVGTANLQVVLPMQPNGIVEATTPITIDDPGTGIGDSGPCSGSDNVLYYRSTYYPHGMTTFQSAANAVWSVLTYPDSARFSIDGAQRLELSLEGLATPLAVGTYTNAQLSPPMETGRPAIKVVSDCDGFGRFQIDELTEDPVLGTLQSITARFDEAGCDDDAYASGCVHYVAPPVTPPPPPPVADPAKLAVTVYQINSAGVPDSAATVIVTDATGTVVLDTQVDSFGFAQVSLIGDAELTVIQHTVGFYEYMHTYRGVHAGNHVIINAGPVTSGAQDQMLATWTAPPGAAVFLTTACGGGSWQGGTGLVDAKLTFYDACRTPTFDMLAIAALTDGSQQWNWQSGLDHVANGNVSVPGPWAPFDHATVTVSNVPANTPGLFTTWSMLIGPKLVEMDRLRIDGPPAGDVPFSLRYAPGAGSGTVIDLREIVGLDTPQMITTVLPDAPASVSVDYAANPVPLLSQVQPTASGASWTETGAGSADMRTVTWEAIANNQKVIWYIEEAYDGQPSTVLPRLPANHAADDPATDPAAQVHGAAVSYQDYDVSSGFTIDPPAPPYVARRTFAQTLSMSQGF